MHVITQISQKVLSLGEARLLSCDFFKKYLLSLLVIQISRTTVLGQLLFKANFLKSMVVTISKLDFVHERAVERTFSNQRSIEKSIPAFIAKLIPIFEALTFINSSESFLFLEPTLLRSQEYLSLNRI